MNIKKLFTLLILVFAICETLFGQNIVNTPHNLSVTGPSDIKAQTETEICIFCHTPHSSKPQSPLWNREDGGISYTIYNSSTTSASIGQPDGASILCLSCHDGTIALGTVISRTSDIDFTNSITTLPPGEGNLTTDLSDDHPISFIFNTSLASADGQLVDPALLPEVIKLENDKLQCISCHDPHENTFGQFLVANLENSVLCQYCHDINGYQNSSHKTSLATWNGIGDDPWTNTNFTTVAQNGCYNCHTSHSAGRSERLMKEYNLEDNCLICHNGNVASSDIQTDILQLYSHNVFNYSNIHDPNEQVPISQMHVECQDCHNGHYANNTIGDAPYASGAIIGVPGINTNGSSVVTIQYEYELCYKCHADSPNRPGSSTARLIEQSNTRLEFDSANPSFHPVESQGTNSNMLSLLEPYTEFSIIKCSDCHASSGIDALDGPHGSIYPQILKFRYETAYNTIESYQNYELCYQCHDRNEIINGTGRFARRVHNRHIIIGRMPCNDCHDPHGISSSQGNSTNNTHLINFRLDAVQELNGNLYFEDLGTYTGSCYLTCHGRDHGPTSY